MPFNFFLNVHIEQTVFKLTNTLKNIKNIINKKLIS